MIEEIKIVIMPGAIVCSAVTQTNDLGKLIQQIIFALKIMIKCFAG